MIRRIASLATLAVVASPLVTIANAPAQAQTLPKAPVLLAQSAEISVPVTVNNISALERKIAGGHSAKVRYTVAPLQGGLALKKIKITLKVTLRDNKVQTGIYETSSPKLSDTIEVKAPGAVLRADEEVKTVEAKVEATATRAFNGFVLGKVNNPNQLGNIIQTPGDPTKFPQKVSIVKLDKLARAVGGGHSIDVNYSINNKPSNVSISQVRVKATFILGDNSVQENTDVFNNPKVSDTVNVKARGSVGKDGEVKRLEIQVAADGTQTFLGSNTKTESAAEAAS
ncbi:hypothetical protein [Calothrix sp. 336/3]|uniref:hypothetical protein n=1 Tax=Calothrix sp. 336/3 TaxID=1337936 RepID=UPI0004E317C8|nr:hypothetical protein [Calothrix sp. 336/3]AKG20887.1 hypothetical protein IJ00_05840 [Calothrix sp. 336/3]